MVESERGRILPFENSLKLMIGIDGYMSLPCPVHRKWFQRGQQRPQLRLPSVQDRLHHFWRQPYQSRRRRAGATHSRGWAAGSACLRWVMAVSGAFVNTPFTPLRNIVACWSRQRAACLLYPFQGKLLQTPRQRHPSGWRPFRRAGSFCLNSSWAFPKWLPALVRPPSALMAAR